MAEQLGSIFVELDLDSSRYLKSQQQLLKDATTTSLSIEQNFKNLGIKTSAEYDLMRQKISNSYNSILNDHKSTANDILRAEQAKNDKLRQLNDQQYGHQETLMNKMSKNIESAYSQIFGALSLAAIGTMAKQTIEASLAMERMNLTMSAAIGNSDMAAKEMQYIREESERLGLNLNETALAYAKFSASTRNTAVEGEETRRIFTSVAEATTALKLPTEQVNGVFLALSQIMSKGKIQAEELRGQLGERLPGAFQLTADAMGITTAELDKMLQDGKVISADVLPKLATKLHETYGDAAIAASKTGQAEINRFNNTLFETKAVVGDSLMPTFISVLNLIKSGVPYIAEFAGGFKLITIDAAASFDKLKVYFGNIKTFMFGSPEEIAQVKTQLSDIEKVAESTKKDIYDSMNKGVTSAKTSAELAAEKMKTTAAAAKNAIKENSKEQQAALKHANEQIEKDLNKLTLTVEEQIQEQADKWEKLGVNKTKIQEWTSAKMAEINRKEAEKVLKIQQAANEQIAQHRRKATDDYEKLMSEEADFAMNENERAMAKITAQEQDKLWKINVMLQEETISWEQYELARTQITANAAANRLEKEFNEAKRRADINYSAIQNIKGMEEEAYQMRIAQIDAEAAKRIKDGGDAVLLAKWVADEQQKAYIQMGKSADDWSKGVQASLLELTRQHTTWGNVAYEVTKAFTDNAKAQLQTNLFAVWKGNIDDIEFDWQSMMDAIGQKLTSKIADMVMEAAAHDILLMFKSEWVEGGSQVLGIVSRVLGFGDSIINMFSGGSSAGYSTGFGDWTEGLGFARGGLVPGVPSGVDSVHAMLAPGEFVIPSSLVSNLAEQGRGGDTMLAHINPAEAAILKMLGGSGTINPRTGLPEFSNGYPDNFYYNGKFGHFERIDPNDPANYLRRQWGDWRYVSPNPADPYQYFFSPIDTMNGAIANWSNAMPTAAGTWFTGGEDTNWVMNPSAGTVTMNSQEGYNAPGGFLGQFGQYLAPALALAGAPFSGGMSMYAYAALMGGAAAGGNIVGQLIGGGSVNFEQALSQGFMTAGAAATGMSIMNLYSAIMDTLATSGIAAGVEGNAMFVADAAAFAGTEGASADALAGFLAEAGELYPSTFAGSIYEQPWYSMALDMASSTAKKQLIKFALNQAFGAATGSGGDAGGHMQVSYEGADDGGLLSNLAGIMSSMQGRGQFNVNPFSARDGLDYVPYDNFPIRAHKGEAVLTAKENRERLSGGGGDANVTIHIENFYGDSDGINMLAQKVGDILDTYKRRGWRA